MAKSNTGAVLEGIQGRLGNAVFRQRGDGFVIARRPRKSSAEPSETQLAHREQFRAATRWSRSALRNPDLLALYTVLGESRELSAYCVGVADYFRAPVVSAIDLSAYTGRPGDPIAILATDDAQVVRVHVKVADGAGAVLEQGQAVEEEAGSGQWVYTATVPSGGVPVTVTATATDNPEHTGSLSVTQGQEPGGQGQTAAA